LGVLVRLYDALSSAPKRPEALPRQLGIEAELADKAIEKLLVHGGAIATDEGLVRGDEGFRTTYARQRDHRRTQIDRVLDYARGKRCRMRALVSHFGDRSDDGAECGVCDNCDPSRAIRPMEPAPKTRRKRGE